MVFDEKKWLELCKYGKTCLGISSQCADGKHVIMLDYDGITYEEMVEDVKRLQRRYKLPDAVIFKTKNGYHAYILKKVTYGELCEIIKDSKCDPWFKDEECRKNMKQVILRISKRGNSTPIPRFFSIIESPYNSCEVSLAHWIFLKFFSGASLRFPRKHNGLGRLRFFLYKTRRD